MLKKLSFAFIAAFFILIISANTCDSPNPYVCPPEPVAEIDPLHAEFSPHASAIFIQLLKSDSCKDRGNLKLFVKYVANVYSKDSLAFLHEGKKIVLRDDGIFPDGIKDDQEYSTIISIDTAQLKNIYDNQTFTAMGNKEVSLKEFDGREVMKTQRIAANKLDPRIDFDALAKGNRVEVKNIFPVLEDIRNKSVYIIDLSVVEDRTRTLLANPATSNPDGAWTFNKVMQNLANTAATGVSTEDFTLNWLQTWLKQNNTVNGDVLTVKPGISTVINAWPKVAGTQKLDMKKSPFKLLAIVNRLDLMENPIFSSKDNGGELRFVFGLMQNNRPVSCVIIFEFGVNKKGTELKKYADKWTKLSTLTVGQPEYNSLLQEITDDVTAAGKNPSKPNSSNLNQLRTDEIAFGGSWELREFNINSTSHLLENVTIKQEPASKFNSDAAMKTLLHNYVSKNEAAIEKNQYKIPQQFEGTNMLGGFSNFPNGGVWGDAQGQFLKSNKARFIISINTCSGCHLNEVGTPGFLHNQNAAFNSITSLSGFIRGKNFAKPLGTSTEDFEFTDTRQIKRSFNDLARRAKLLWAYTNSHPTFFGLQFNPVNMEH